MHVSFLIRRRRLTAWLKNSRVGNFRDGSGKTLLDRELFDNHDPFGIYFGFDKSVIFIFNFFAAYTFAPQINGLVSI